MSNIDDWMQHDYWRTKPLRDGKTPQSSGDGGGVGRDGELHVPSLPDSSLTQCGWVTNQTWGFRTNEERV